MIKVTIEDTDTNETNIFEGEGVIAAIVEDCAPTGGVTTAVIGTFTLNKLHFAKKKIVRVIKEQKKVGLKILLGERLMKEWKG